MNSLTATLCGTLQRACVTAPFLGFIIFQDVTTFFTVLSAQCFGYVVRVCHANKACLNTVTVRLVEQTGTVG